jgi:hypothetical protein
MKRLSFVFALVGALFAPNAGRAGITFQYVTDAASYSGAAGSTASVSVYLQETDSGGATLFGSSAIKGLASYGVYVTGSGGSSTISSFTSAGQFNGFGTSQSVPNQTANANSSSTASLPNSNSIDYFNSVPGGVITNAPTLVSGSAGNGVYQILVGTLSVNVGSSTTYTLTSMYNSPGDNASAGSAVTFTLPGGSSTYNLDSTGTFNGIAGNLSFTGAAAEFATFTVSAAAVPEPSSMLLCGLAACGMGYGAWRRRKGKLAAETDTTPAVNLCV